MKKITLRDLERGDYEQWQSENCARYSKTRKGVECLECIFRRVNCGRKDNNFWLLNKDLFSADFLDQTIVIRKDGVITGEEKKKIKNIVEKYMLHCDDYDVALFKTEYGTRFLKIRGRVKKQMDKDVEFFADYECSVLLKDKNEFDTLVEEYFYTRSKLGIK